MADALVSIALEKLTHILGQQLTLLAGAKDELRRLQQTFQHIKAVIDDAERKQVTQDSVRVWLSNLKQVAYDIDDLLEDVLEKNRSNDDDGDAANRVSHCASACLPSPYTCLYWPVSRSKLARDVQEIRKRLDEIAKDKDQFNTSHISSSGGDTRPLVRRIRTMTSSYAKEVMIGRDDDIKTLKSELVCGSGSSSGYDQQQVQGHFKDALYWVCVSEDFDSERVTKAIIEQVKGASTSLSQLDSLQNELVEGLRGKRFLLILDDVWNEDKQRWNILQPCLIGGAPGSRILVTTRVRKVAENITNITYIHHLKGLSDDDSWELFRSIAFDGRTTEECSQLESVGREIVSKCKGVPLSIRVMGSMMNSKRTEADWQNILNSKIWSLREAEEKLIPVLLLSYYNLPPYLKQCFAYCSMFPKDWKLEKSMLVRLWEAQGFIRAEGNREIEDIGSDYFDDLVAWSMLQEVEKDDSGEIRCKMHDLLHDLAEFIAKDEIYTFVRTVGKSEQCSSRSNVRHAFFFFIDTDASFPRAKKLHTLLVRGVVDASESLIADILHQARSLRALVVVGSLVKLPDAIGKIKHLRYLDLSYSNIVELPEAVSHLHNLQRLNLNYCRKLENLPRDMARLVNLRHLEIEGTDGLQYLPKGLGRITSLRSLCKFIVGFEDGCKINELQWLNSLQGSLRIEGLASVPSREEAEKAQLWNKPHLRSLDLPMVPSNDVAEGLRPPANLEELILDSRGFGELKLPSWVEGMPCLSKLEFRNCLKLDRLPHLPSLKEFSISDLESGTLPDGGWERLVTLQKLEIKILYGLKSLPDGLTQLQSLEDLFISYCANLESLPEGLGQLKKLKSLRIEYLKMLTHLPDSLGQLESLETLQIYSRMKLKSLPEGLGQLKKLKSLRMADLKMLTHLPDSLGQLESLETLKIFWCEKLESLPEGLGQLKKLKSLEIEYLEMLTHLPDSLGQLEVLNCLVIGGCNALGSLPHGLQHLSHLQRLRIYKCPLVSERCKREGGADWSKISHIPNICIDDERIQEQRR
ncbi:hypothetical protein ACLOJK_037980 [Asimina triloba]